MPRTYVNNASNRSLGRVGMPVGSMVVSRGSSGGGGSYGGSGYSSSSASSRSYVDNAYNRSVGRVGMPVGSMVISKGSSSAGSGGGSYDYSSSSRPASSSETRTYVDNSYNRQHGRVGLPVGSAVISKSGSFGDSASFSSSTRTYVDNSYNRQHGRVGLPVGSAVISKSGSFGDSASFSSSTRTYVDNAYNRQHGRVGLPVGSAVISKSGSSGDSASFSSSTKTYVDNSYNRRHDRVGLPVGSAVISKAGSSVSGSEGKVYVDNEMNRKLGRVGMPCGTCVVSKSSKAEGASPKFYIDNAINQALGRVGKPHGTCVVSKTLGVSRHSPKVYVDNKMNRRLGRVGHPLGTMPVSKVSRTTKQIRDMEQAILDDSFERRYPCDDDGGLGGVQDNLAMELALARLNRKLQEHEWREKFGHKKVQTVKSLENYKGTKINFEDLKLGKKIGAGGFGDVYFAEWEGDVVAVKKFRVQRVSKRRLEEFTKEVLAFCDLDHPNIVGYIGACVTAPNLCIVMEYMQTSLYEALHIQNDVQFTEAERLKIIRGSCGGLEYLHERSIAHCDLKSQNVLLDYTTGKTCVVKITDFGLSMMKANSESSTSAGEQVRNVGTPRYSAPEVLRGEMLSRTDMRRADVYSLGLVVFEVVFEEEPFYDLGYAQLKKQVGENGLLPDMSEGREVTSCVRDMVETCLELQPKHRPEVAQLRAIFGDMESLYR